MRFLTGNQCRSLSAAEMSAAEHDQIQTGKINAGYLNLVDKEIKQTEARIEFAIANLNEPVNDQEGKIVAGMISMIERELEQVKVLRLELDSKEDIFDVDTAPIFEKIELIKMLIVGLVS